MNCPDWVDYQTEPSRYRHWKLRFDGPVATLLADFDENAGLRPGYKLKLNSYDLGVDIELSDAVNRIRFEHPEVRTVVVTSARERVFCSGANIFMLGVSSHAWKVNFCKFTNETRNGLEDSSSHGGLKFLAAVNGSCAGGGYELALACDEILLIDDRSSAVSLPEVPLLGVLPGTGGLTRLTDKRHVRHDLADVFCTTSEGVRGQKALDWRLVDAIAKPAQFAAKVRERALALGARSGRPGAGTGVALTPIERVVEADALRYSHVTVEIDRQARAATFTIRGPAGPQPRTSRESRPPAPNGIRSRSPASSKTRSCRCAPMNSTSASGLSRPRARPPQFWRWMQRSTRSGRTGSWRKRSAICAGPSAGSTSLRAACSLSSSAALVLPALYFELALACDRIYHLALPGEEAGAPRIVVGEANFGDYPMATGQSRLARRFYDEKRALAAVKARIGEPLDANAAFALGLATSAPDDIDWADEVRIAVEERVSLSPDALTAMEANLRFDGPETMATRVFGRLTAWQNWIFQRPNAVGEKGALKVYGKGEKAAFDWNRV